MEQRLHPGLSGRAMTVLVLADEVDLGADLVVRELSDLEVPVARIDIGWFPRRLTLDAEFRDGRWRGRLVTAHRSLELDDVRSALYRGPTAFHFPSGLSATERRHAHHEAKLGVGGVLAALPALWVNHPSRIADAGYKPVQLATATRCGLRVPPTLVTNSAGAARRFATGARAGGVVTKMLGAPGIFELGGRRVAFTSRVNAADLADLRGIEVTAHQFQHWVTKRYEVRVIVIGEQVFPVAIHAGSAAARIDWRADYKALRYELVDPPAQVVAGIELVMKELSLSYGAFDFVVTPAGEWVFLEVNPSGQYGWLETETNAPMSAALARLLAKGAR